MEYVRVDYWRSFSTNIKFCVLCYYLCTRHQTWKYFRILFNFFNFSTSLVLSCRQLVYSHSNDNILLPIEFQWIKIVLIHERLYNGQFGPPGGFLKSLSCKEMMTFNIIIRHFFPENFNKIPQVFQKLWRISLSILTIFINFY